MIRKNQIAKDVRVKLNNSFIPKCIGEKYLIKDSLIWIADPNIYNDSIGEYVHLHGVTPNEGDQGTYLNSGYAYLNQIDLEFPINY